VTITYTLAVKTHFNIFLKHGSFPSNSIEIFIQPGSFPTLKELKPPKGWDPHVYDPVRVKIPGASSSPVKVPSGKNGRKSKGKRLNESDSDDYEKSDQM
jgi:hypothetical protein